MWSDTFEGTPSSETTTQGVRHWEELSDKFERALEVEEEATEELDGVIDPPGWIFPFFLALSVGRSSFNDFSK